MADNPVHPMSARSKHAEGGVSDRKTVLQSENVDQSVLSEFPAYNVQSHDFDDSNDLHIYVHGRSDEDSTYSDNYSEKNSLLNKEDQTARTSCFGAKLFLLLWVVVVVICIIFRKDLSILISKFAKYVDKIGPISFLYYVLLLTVSYPLFMPLEIIFCAAGFIFSHNYGRLWGVVFASLASMIGYLFGSVICFMISRYFLYDTIKSYFDNNEYYNSINRALDAVGIRMVAMLRLSPLLPASVISYMIGTTDISMLDYLLGTLAAYPCVFVVCYIGSLLGHIVTDTPFSFDFDGILLFCFCVVLTSVSGVVMQAGIYYTYYEARRRRNV